MGGNNGGYSTYDIPKVYSWRGSQIHLWAYPTILSRTTSLFYQVSSSYSLTICHKHRTDFPTRVCLGCWNFESAAPVMLHIGLDSESFTGNKSEGFCPVDMIHGFRVWRKNRQIGTYVPRNKPYTVSCPASRICHVRLPWPDMSLL